jgi:transcriptional regulator with XRE-family HTH domain
MASNLNSPEYILLREMLRRERCITGLSQEEVAADLGRAQSFVSKYEKGERRLDVVDFIRLCDVLCINPTALVRELCKKLKEQGQYWESPRFARPTHSGKNNK